MRVVQVVGRRMGGFAVSVVVSAVAGLAAIPLVVHGAGPAGWADLAVGQSAGTIAGVAIAYGWGVFGAARVGAAADDVRPVLFSASMRIRSALFVVVAPGAAAIGAVTAVHHPVEAAVTAVTFSLVGLGAAWYFIGAAQPRSLLVAETVPRAAGTLLGGIAAGTTHSLLAYAFIQLGGYIVAVVVAWVKVLRGSGARPFSRTSGAGTADGDVSGLVTALCHQVYIAVPTLVVSTLAPSVLPSYALADRTLRYANNAVQPFGQTLQGWVPRGPAELLGARMRRAVAASIVFGAACGIGFAVLAPAVAGAISLGAVRIGFALSVPLGAVIMLSAVSLCTGTSCLVLLGRSAATARSAVLGAVTGLPFMVIAAPLAGGPGVAWGVVVAEGVALLYQVVALVRVRPGARRDARALLVAARS